LAPPQDAAAAAQELQATKASLSAAQKAISAKDRDLAIARARLDGALKDISEKAQSPAGRENSPDFFGTDLPRWEEEATEARGPA